jgi:L-lactate dehydrogenase complex protein LldE
MHVNSGYFKEAVPVVANHVRAFESEDYDVAVAPSGSCVASVKHQHPMVARRAGDAGLEERATAVGKKTYELSELLVDVLGVTDPAEQLGSYFPHTVTYHPSCHGMRLLKLGDRQAGLLRGVKGLELVDLPEADQCCGFGGTFSVKNADVSSAMLEDKTANIRSTGASVCAGGDYSCLMHIGGGLSRQDSGVATLHLAEILASTESEPAAVPGTAGQTVKVVVK